LNCDLLVWFALKTFSKSKYGQNSHEASIPRNIANIYQLENFHGTGKSHFMWVSSHDLHIRKALTFCSNCSQNLVNFY
jgi:hypothetical protein